MGLRQVLPGRPSRTILLGLLAICLVTLGAIAWRQWPQRFLLQGETALRERRYDDARVQLERYLSYRPRDPQAHLLAARAARELQEYFAALEHLRQCGDHGGDAEAIQIETALIAVSRGQEPEAWLRQRAEHTDEPALHILEVLIQFDLDTYRLKDALQKLTRYLEQRPDDLQARMARGFVLEKFLYFNEALEEFSKAVNSHPENEPAQLKLAQMTLIAGTPQEALSHFQRLHLRQPEQPEVMLGLARSHRLLGETEKARGLLTSLVTTAPQASEPLFELGQLELDDGRPEAAEIWLRRARQANPYDRRIAHNLSRCLAALGRNEEAEQMNHWVAEIDADLRRIDELRDQVMANPESVELRREAALIFLRNGEREEGIRWLKQALRLDPHDEEVRHALATALEQER